MYLLPSRNKQDTGHLGSCPGDEVNIHKRRKFSPPLGLWSGKREWVRETQINPIARVPMKLGGQGLPTCNSYIL